MQIKPLTPELLRGLEAAPVPTPEQQDRLEVRLLTLYLTWQFINSLVGPITYIYGVQPSLLHQVAALSHGEWLVGALFGAALMLAMPHAIALLCLPRTLAIRWPRKCATLAAVLVTVTWCYLGVLALPLDLGPLAWLYFRQGLESVGLAFLYAISLNAQLLRAIANLLHPS